MAARLLELMIVYTIVCCTSVFIQKLTVRQSMEPFQPSPELASETDVTEDVLSEKTVETQTCNRNYLTETSRLKRRHRREMKRLNRQTMRIKRRLASQWREAGHTLELKNKLLKELQDKLVPLEKERDTQTQEKDLIERQIEEERQHYTDIMSRIERVNHQLVAIGVHENISKPETERNYSSENLLSPFKAGELSESSDASPQIGAVQSKRNNQNEAQKIRNTTPFRTVSFQKGTTKANAELSVSAAAMYSEMSSNTADSRIPVETRDHLNDLSGQRTKTQHDSNHNANNDNAAVLPQASPATEGTTGIPVESSTETIFENATRSVVGGATESIVEGATESILQGATETTIESATGITVEGATRITIEGATGTTIKGTTGTTVEGATRKTIEGATGTTIEGATGTTIEGATGTTIKSATGTAVVGNSAKTNIGEANGVNEVDTLEPEINCPDTALQTSVNNIDRRETRNKRFGRVRNSLYESTDIRRFHCTSPRQPQNMFRNQYSSVSMNYSGNQPFNNNMYGNPHQNINRNQPVPLLTEEERQYFTWLRLNRVGPQQMPTNNNSRWHPRYRV